MSLLVLMCGIPGSGKSTLAKGLVNEEFDLYVSRDEIRFEIVPPEHGYFSQEDLVFDTFIQRIADGIKEDKTVFADATHLTVKARKKVLHRLVQFGAKPDDIDIIWVNTPIDVAIERNERRKGTRAYVPTGVIRRMGLQIEEPEYDEIPEGYNNIFIKEVNLTLGLKPKEKH